MFVHYFTLRTLSKELDESFRGASIIEAFSQQKNELCLMLENNGAEMTLCVSVESGMNYCLLRNDFNRARKNSVDLFQPLVGLGVKQISIHPTERILLVDVENGMKLFLQLYNTAASNILLTDSEQVVSESFKRGDELNGTLLTISSRGDWNIVKDIQHFSDALKQFGDKQTEESIRKILPMFGTLYSRETIVRSGLDGLKQTDLLSETEIQSLFDSVTLLLHELEHAQPVVYYEEETPVILSMLELQHCKEKTSKQFENVNEAVRMLLGKSFRAKSFEQKKNELLDAVRRSLNQTERTVKAIEKELTSSERAEEYERTGHTIMANLHSIKKGMKHIELSDLYDSNKQLDIQLEPALTPHQNAERYFEKARKAKLARTEAEQRLQSQNRQLALFQDHSEELAKCNSLDELKEWTKRNEEHLSFLKSPKNEEERIPFRVFTVAGGFEVWVGKSSANNDLLTTKYAKPNDLWFHARGVGGSHTVLKVSNGRIPSREAIMQTASIAAYYSKMRNASNVPVAYCERKYVRKPKGTQEGIVFLEREEVVFVEPRLP
jgi:predicted ribosome quality control (RQC) complex YloA/Tae2 family protein